MKVRELLTDLFLILQLILWIYVTCRDQNKTHLEFHNSLVLKDYVSFMYTFNAKYWVYNRLFFFTFPQNSQMHIFNLKWYIEENKTNKKTF